MVVSGTVLLVASAAFMVHDVLRARAGFEAELRAHASLVAVNATAPLATGDRRSADETARAAGLSDHVLRVRLHDASNQVFAEFNRDVEQFQESQLPYYLHAEAPIVLDGKIIGRVSVVSDKGAVIERIKRYTWIALPTILAALLLAFAMSSNLQRRISSPILKVGSVARRVADGHDYSLRADAVGADEISELTRDFNAMLGHIEDRDVELEGQVQKRTSELVKLNEQLKHQAYHDALTKLPNRALFDDRLTLAIAQAERAETAVAVLFLDLDRFKTVNDTLGHEVGDELLRAVADRIESSVRKQDTVSRLGGDEFTIILTGLQSSEYAGKVAQTIIENVRQPLEIQGYDLQISTSIGISLYPDDGTSVTALKRNADAAMYAAKESGRATYQFFSLELNELMRTRLQMQTDLDRAITEDRLLVHYQPQVDVSDNRLVAIEALARWPHPERGILKPAEFISFAEDNGLIARIDMWVLRSACEFFSRRCGDADGDLRLAVNISVDSLRRRNLIEDVEGVLNDTGMRAEQLELEVSESALIRNDVDIAGVMRGLKDIGVMIAVDDFGTGYSVLKYLKHYVFDSIKIDQEFVRHMQNDLHDSAIVNAIVAIATSLNLKVVAEGVETAKEAQNLKAIGCTKMQGFLFSGPLPEAPILDVVRRGYLFQSELAARRNLKASL